MKFTVGQLLASNQFPEMKLLSGENSLANTIEGIRIIEIVDMERYLIGGEMLLTSFSVYEHCSRNEFIMHLHDLVKKHVSCFVVKKNVNIYSYAERLEALKKFCSEEGIPVIEIPNSLYYWPIIKFVLNSVYDEQIARLKYFKLTHDNFNTLAFSGHCESHNTSKNIINLLATMIENPISLYYSNYKCFVTTDERFSNYKPLENQMAYTPGIITKFKYLRQKGKYVEYIVKINVMKNVEILLVITELNRKLSDLDYMAIENAIINLQYGFISEFAQYEIEKKYQHDIVHSLLTGTLEGKHLSVAANQLNLSEDEYYRVVSFHTIQKSFKEKFTEEQLNEASIIEGELINLLPGQRIYRNIDHIVMIQKMDLNQDLEKYKAQMEELQCIVKKNIRYRKKKTHFYIGIGCMVKGYKNLQKSYNESIKALKYVKIARIISKDVNKSVIFYENLGFFKMFTDIDDVNIMAQYIPETLKKVYAFDDSHDGDMIHTLETYLDAKLSMRKSSEMLNVHYRTVSYRLDKIRELSGIDFDNINELLAVKNGLMIHKIIEAYNKN